MPVAQRARVDLDLQIQQELLLAVRVEASLWLVQAAGVRKLRTIGDGRRLRDAVESRRRIVIVGGGFVGLEVAATATSAGCEVTVVEALATPLLGVLGPFISEWLTRQHRERGVRLRCGVTVASSKSTPDGERLVLSDGSDVMADLVVVGVGISRDLDWLSEAGLAVHIGLVCDADGRTNVPGVFGAGDVVCRHHGDRCEQVQHWTAANLSARRVAGAVLAIEAKVPVDDAFFWSNQYDLRIQFAGRAGPHTQFELTDGDLEGSFAGRYTVDGMTTGALGINRPRDFLHLRRGLGDEDGGRAS